MCTSILPVFFVAGIVMYNFACFPKYSVSTGSTMIEGYPHIAYTFIWKIRFTYKIPPSQNIILGESISDLDWTNPELSQDKLLYAIPPEPSLLIFTPDVILDEYVVVAEGIYNDVEFLVILSETDWAVV